MGLSVRMHRFLFLAALICGCLNAILGSTVSATDSSHGIPSETWGSNYGNTGYSSVTGMVTDSAGNTIFTGLIMPAGTSPVDYSTVKYGESGGLSWVRNFSEPMDMGNNLRFDAPELSEDIAADRAGNVIVTGYRYKFSDSECVTIKYSPEGAVRWIRKYDTATYDFCSVIASDDDGNIYVGVDSPGLADTARIIKYDINGNTVFVVPNVPGNPVSYIFDLAVDAAGNIYALAHKQSDTKTYLLVKWNASGSIAWLKPYFTGSLCGSSLAVSSNGIFVSSGVCGASDNKAIKTTKYDTQGNEIWTYNYSGDGGAYSLANISGIATDSGGSVYINGGLVNTAASRLITLKIDGEGGLAWEKWHGDGFAPYKITVDGTNHLYLGGRVVNVSTIGFQIRKYDQQQSSTIDLQAGTITASLAGSQIHIADSVSNAGNTSATGVTVHYYLSTDAGDAGITTADILLGVRTIDAISAGSSSAGDVTFSIPAGLAGGRYHIGMIVDPLNTVTESDEGNNSAIGNELVLPFPAPIAVVISSPAQGSCMNSRAVTVSGTVGNAIAPAVSAAGVSAMVSGNAFSVADVALVEGANVITVAATDAPGNSGSASVALTVDTVSPAVTGFTVMADPKLTLLIPLKIGFSEAPDMATIPPNIFITGKSGDVAGAFSLSGNDVLFMPSAEFRPNETYTVTVNNGVKDLCGNSLATVFAGSFETRIGPAFVHGEVYDDATGLPLAGAVIRMTSIDGDAPDPAIETTTDIMGRYGFEYNAGSGDAHIVIGRDGYTSAYRNAAVWPGRSFEVFDARLTPVASPASITVLGQQGLAGRLPSGWSPVYAVDVRSSGSTLALPGTLLIKNTYGFSGAGSVVAARFDEETSKWIASDISFEGENIAIGVNAAGQYALLVADTAPSVPPMPAGVGAPILPAATANPDTGNAVVEVTPPAVFSAIGARGLTSVVVTTPTPIPSGTAVRARITEKYDLSSGETVSKEPFDQDIVLYAWPIDGSDNTLSAGFPVTPSETYPLGTLRHGSVEIDVALAPQDASAGNVIGVAGGIVTGETGNVGLTIAASALLGDTSFTLNALAAPDLPPIDSSAPDFIGGIDLRMRGNGFAPDAVPEFTLPGALPADSDVIMTRAGMISGIPAQTVAAVGKISGGRVAITRCLSSPCIADGRYGFYVSPGQLAFISGQVFKSGAPASGVELRSQSLPFRYISDIGGGFTVVALAGSYAVSAIERGTGLESASSGSVSAGETALATLNLAVNPPVVASVTPFDKATGVDASARIEILFSKPVNPSTVTNASISLYQSVPGLAIPPVLVAGRASLVSGTRAVFTPESALRANAIYRLRVSSAITDSYGTPLSPVETVFTTAVVLGNAALEAGQLRAGLPDESGMMAISGGRGLAAPGSPVVLFNRTRNIVVTVTTDEDGSFTGTLAGAIGDKVDVYVEDLLGNVTVLDPGIFQNPDGSAAVGPEGGVMQGPGEIETYVPGGAFDEAMVIKVSAAAADLLEELTADPAVQSVGAFQIDTSGVRAKEELKISLPAPDWVTPDDQIIITKVVNFRGRDELTLVCPAVLRDGRIYSTSPPFDGVYDGGYYGVQVHLEDGVGYAMVDAWVVDELRTWIAGKAGLTFPVYKEVRRRFPVTVPVNKPFNVTLRGLDGTELRTVSIQGPTERGQMLPFVVHLTNDHTPPKPVKRSIPDDAVGILPWGDEYSITFDEPIAPESVNSETVKVTDSQGNAVVGVARLSGDGREIVFVPAYGYRYGETYTIAINGVKDNGGNELTGTTGRFTTFKPEVLSSVGSFPEAARLVKFNDRVAVMGHTRYGSFVLTNSYLSLVDVSDPYNPRNLGVGQVTETSDADARGKLLLQYANDIKAVENLPLTGINNADLSGDYIVTAGYTQWNYNGRTHRGRLGYIKSGQLSNPDSLVNDDLYLSWNPGNDDPPPPGAPYHRGEPMEMTIYGTNAYIANSGLGVQAVDLTQMAGNKAGAIGGTYSGSGTTAENLYNSISRAGDKILAVRGDELVILGTDLRPLGSFAGLNHAYGVTGVEKYPIDIDGDGNLGDYEDWDGDATTSAQESFDLALVSTSDGVVVIDVTEPGAANKLDLIGNARGRVKADREKRVGYANGGAVIFSLRHLRAGLDVSALDTAEDRVLYRSSEPGGAFDISEDGSLLYAANGSTGVMKVVKVGEMTTLRLVTDDADETPLNGAVTDGVSRLRIKITADNWQALPPLTIRLQDSQLANASASTTGTLLDGNGNPADSLPVVFDSQGVARVLYRAPDSFVRWGAGKTVEDQDKELAGRQVRITLNEKVVSPAIELKRPPVVLVHGLWSDKTTWQAFESNLNERQQFDIVKADYSRGDYSNAGALSQNYPVIDDAIDKALGKITTLRLAATKVDIVTHSMGGLLVREHCRQESLAGRACNEQIHKLITIDTPHKGSEVANVVQSVQDSISPALLGLPEFNFDNPVCKGIIPLLNNRLKKQTRSGAIDDLATGSTALSDLGQNRTGVPSNAVAGITAAQVIAHNFEVKMLWTGLMVGCGLKSDPDMGINFDGLPLFGREVGQFLEIKISEGAALVDMAGTLYESLMACTSTNSNAEWQELLDNSANCLVNGVSGVSNALIDNLRNFISALPQESGLVMPALWSEGNDRIVSRSSETGGLDASAVTEINHVDHLSVHKQSDAIEQVRSLLELKTSEASGKFSPTGF